MADTENPGSGSEGSNKAAPSGRSALVNASWNAFITCWNIAISFLLAPPLIHHLGTSHYGILLVIWSVTGILSIMNMGLGEATLRYVAHYRGQNDMVGVNRVFGSTMSFYIVVSLIVFVGMFAATPQIAGFLSVPPGERNLVESLLRLAAISFGLGIISRAVGCIPMAEHRYDISSKLNMVQSLARSLGYVVILLSKFGLLYILLWDITLSAVFLVVQVAIARRLVSGIQLWPSFKFSGLKEIFGYSIFSFLTFVFLTMQRESGKIVLSRFLGPSAVAYLGPPETVSSRLHMIVAGGSETLLPRFSTTRDPATTRSLFWNGTWSALVISLILLVPLIVLLPDFLRLWINSEFSTKGSLTGQLVAFSFIAQGAFATPAAFFRGTGKPWFVTIVILAAGVITLTTSILLIPRIGLAGIGYAYAISSVAPLLGTVIGWVYAFGRGSARAMLRWIALPCAMALTAYLLQTLIRGFLPDLNWFTLVTFGGVFTVMTAAFIFIADISVGGEISPARQFMDQAMKSKKVSKLMRLIPLRRVPKSSAA